MRRARPMKRRIAALVTIAVCLAMLRSPVSRAQEKPPAPIWRTCEFQVMSKQDAPVVGATVSPWQVAYGRGSMRLGEPLEAPLKPDAEGKFELVVRQDAPFIATVEEYGIRSFAESARSSPSFSICGGGHIER